MLVSAILLLLLLILLLLLPPEFAGLPAQVHNKTID
jgi:hypothetical protein